MDSDALTRREPLQDIVAATLARGWSEQFGVPFRVSSRAFSGGQEWRLHRTLSMYTHRSIDRSARRFVADGHRYTRSRSKLPARWLRGTIASSKVVQSLAARPERMWVMPALSHASSLVILPGNQRVRVFDLRRGRVRTLLKDGFDPASLLVEIEVRSSSGPGPFPALTDYDRAAGWFEESLVKGFNLAVCPPWRPYQEYLSRAGAQLDNWLQRTAVEADTGAHAQLVAERAGARADQLERAYGVELVDWVAAVVNGLVTRARRAGRLEHAVTHGDLQPGNVLVARDDGQVYLIDWEASGWRLRHYDGLVLGLLRRFEPGREQRLDRYVADGTLNTDIGLVPRDFDREQRAAIGAAVVLEDVDWALREAATGRSYHLPLEIPRLLAEAGRALDGALR